MKKELFVGDSPITGRQIAIVLLLNLLSAYLLGGYLSTNYPGSTTSQWGIWSSVFSNRFDGYAIYSQVSFGYHIASFVVFFPTVLTILAIFWTRLCKPENKQFESATGANALTQILFVFGGFWVLFFLPLVNTVGQPLSFAGFFTYPYLPILSAALSPLMAIATFTLFLKLWKIA